jgi:hypothetical protein
MNDIEQKFLADYGQYLNQPMQGYAEGGLADQVPKNEDNMAAWNARGDAAVRKDTAYRPGVAVTYSGGKFRQIIPQQVKQPIYGPAPGFRKPAPIIGYQMVDVPTTGRGGKPPYEVAYSEDPREYIWDKFGNKMGRLPSTFGGVSNSFGLQNPFNINALGTDKSLRYAMGGLIEKYDEGGEVKGYARGTENGPFYDETDPDFAAQVQNNMNENPLYAQREVAAPAPAARPSAVEEALAQRRAIMADLNKALTAAPATTSGMTDSERNWRLAAAFAKPGKTGAFGEGLGYAAETMADVAAEKRKEAREASAIGLQRLQARSELANQQYAMAREGEMQDLLKKYVSKGQGVTDKVASGATSQSGGASDGVPEDVKALILAQPTEKAVATIIEIAKENNKPSDLIKGVNFLVKNGAISQEQGNAIVQENLQGKLEQLDVQVPELGGTVKLTGPEARLYYNDGTLPTRLGGKAKTTAATSPDTSVAPAKPAAAPMTQEQMKAKETGMVEQAKKDIDASDALLSQKSFAKQQKDAAKLILGYAKTSPKSFGVIADPNWSNAVATLLETGVNTPFGSLGLAVEEPIAKLKLTGPEATVRQMAAAPIALIEVGYRKLYLKGEGAVSNMEGALTKYIGPQLSDNAKTVQLKAGMITINAEKQEKIVDAFEKYKEAHPEAGPRSFYQTPEYKRIVDSYETKYRAFAKANGIPVDESPASSGPSKGGNLLDSLQKDPRWNK